VESVLSQRGDFLIEYIIVDGKSADATLGILDEYQKALRQGEYPIQCKGVDLQIVSEKDEGMYDALSKGFGKVTGDVVGYINSDDFYLPNAFSTVSDIFSLYDDVEWLTGMPTCFNEKGQIVEIILPLAYPSSWIRRGLHGTALYFVQQESTFFRSKILHHLDMERFRSFRYAGDYYIWHVAAQKSDLYIVESCLGGFRLRKGQLSGNKEQYRREFSEIAEERKLFDGFNAYLYSKLNRYMSNPRKRKFNNKIIYFRDGRWARGGE
jgi:glycosyltransferase involved in cell wall biosynthesis